MWERESVSGCEGVGVRECQELCVSERERV